jgi:hypothetical protein
MGGGEESVAARVFTQARGHVDVIEFLPGNAAPIQIRDPISGEIGDLDLESVARP